MNGAIALRRRRPLRLSPTLSVYIARQFVTYFFGLFAGLVSIVFLISVVDLLDRLATKEQASLRLVLELALLRLPFLAQEVLPFGMLAAGMFTFWRMTRSNELVVARAAGISVWQFLLPAITASLGLGLLAVTLLNPLGSVLLARYEVLEDRFLHNRASQLTVSDSGLWLRQPDPEGQAVIHATRVDQGSMTLFGVIVFRFRGEDEFIGRIDAETARLQDGAWHLRQAWVGTPGDPSQFRESIDIPTDLTSNKILESFAPPETISFWSLPDFIELLESAGFSAQRHRLQFHKLSASPVLFAGMVLLAASFSLRPQRRGRVGLVILCGALAGFFIYFLSSFIFALGLSGKIPVHLAAWTPAGVATMLGTALLFHLEDG